jgi:predicted phosphodiesterase
MGKRRTEEEAEAEMINTIVISDIHLGTPVSQQKKVLEVLKKNFQNLIINGDLFDSDNFRRYQKEDWKILSKIRKLTKTHKVILVKGNHDPDVEFLSAITGMYFVDYYSFEVGGKTFYVEHGDKHDFWINHRPLVTWFFTGLYYHIQKLDKRKSLSRKIKGWSKSWIEAKEIVRTKMLKKHSGFDYVLAGHTHYPEIYVENDMTYINSGSFCDEECSYIEIDNFGNAKLKYI